MGRMEIYGDGISTLAVLKMVDPQVWRNWVNIPDTFGDFHVPMFQYGKVDSPCSSSKHTNFCWWCICIYIYTYHCGCCLRIFHWLMICVPEGLVIELLEQPFDDCCRDGSWGFPLLNSPMDDTVCSTLKLPFWCFTHTHHMVVIHLDSWWKALS